jgi:hypothetical protein
VNGFITLAVGDGYLQRAAAFAISARRFGFPTVLLHAAVDVGRWSGLFAKTVEVEFTNTVNGSRFHQIWRGGPVGVGCHGSVRRASCVRSIMTISPDQFGVEYQQPPRSSAGPFPVRWPVDKTSPDRVRVGVINDLLNRSLIPHVTIITSTRLRPTFPARRRQEMSMTRLIDLRCSSSSAFI